MIRIFALLTMILVTPMAQADVVRLAVTTSFHNSGLSDVLLPAFKQDTSIEVQLLVVGTGQALRLGAAGDVDAVLVHARKAEDAFVTAGHGTYRREIMYNDFVLVGPSDDPAAIAGATSATEALERIADNQALFISRGDDSGTHAKELSLWSKSGRDLRNFGGWYKEVGSGMGASLNTAAGMGAYILTDRASWLNFANQAGLKLLYAGDPALRNQYALIPVNPRRHNHTNHKAVRRLEEWLTSDKVRLLINSFRIKGDQLFIFNAR